MELLREEIQTQAYNAETEAQKHNAMISERYKRLQNAVANQFAEDTYTKERVGENTHVSVDVPEKTTYISPNTVNSATYAQTPTVTEYISRASSALFTTERFERMQPVQEEMTVAEPVAVATPVQNVAVKMEAQYSLSAMAKLVMAVFAVVIVAMLTLICVNTHTINQKRMNIENLEARKAELIEQNEQVQRRIEDATSEETIREYAESQGMVQTGNQ